MSCPPFRVSGFDGEADIVGPSPGMTAGALRHRVREPGQGSVERGGRVIGLQPREFRLLTYLLLHQGRVVTRTMLLESVWDYRFDPQTNVIDVHISRLRSKIDKDASVPLIHTVRGVGYTLSSAGPTGEAAR